MTARRTALLCGGVGVAAVLLLTGCATSSASSGQSRATGASTAAGAGALQPQTATAGPVEVEVTPQRIDAGTAQFTVALNNHQVELDGDYAATSTLTVAGIRWSPGRWSGAGPGGHHREGTLTFGSRTDSSPASALPPGQLELHLGGLPAPVILRWTLPGSRN